MKIRSVQGHLVFEITARDDAAFPGAVALEVEKDTAWRGGFGLDSLLPVRRARDEWDESFEVESFAEFAVPGGSNMGALGAVEESFPRKVGHGDDGDEGINPCALLR